MRCLHKTVTRLAVCALALATLGQAAKADSLRLHYDPGAFSDGANGGGEFEAYNLSNNFQFADPQATPPSLATSGYGIGQAWDSTNQKTFQTFCTEDTVYFTPEVLYYTFPTTHTHDNRALTPQVAYLFNQFWNGALDNYDFNLGAGRTASSLALQQAIWTLLGDPNWPLANLPSLGALSKAWITEADNAVAGAWGNTIGNVRILELNANPDGTGPAQDQLVEVANETIITHQLVPLPSSAWGGMVLLAGSGAMTMVRRRNAAALAVRAQ